MIDWFCLCRLAFCNGLRRARQRLAPTSYSFILLKSINSDCSKREDGAKMTQNIEPLIGVVGGVGPYAGLDLLRQISDNTQADSDQEHVSVLSISAPAPIVDRTVYILGKTKENPAFQLANQIELLANAGASFVGIPCNTAHATPIFSVIESELDRRGISIKLLNMIGEMVHYIQVNFPQMKRIGILSTLGSYQTQLHQNFLAQADYIPVIPDAAHQEIIHRSIYHPDYGIKKAGYLMDDAAKDIREVVQHLQAVGVDALVLGCTELPLALTDSHFMGIPLINPTQILARALIREVAPHKLLNLQLDNVI